jgi:hypothetical protein
LGRRRGLHDSAANGLVMAFPGDDGLDEYFADYERRAAKRRERRTARRRRRGPPRGELGWLMASTGGRTLVGLVAAVAALTVLGLVLLWPHGGGGDRPALLPPTLAAHVDSVHETACDTPTPQRCRELAIRVGNDRTTMNVGPITSAPDVRADSTVRVSKVPYVAGAPPPRPDARYSFVDVERRGSLVIALALVAGLAHPARLTQSPDERDLAMT